MSTSVNAQSFEEGLRYNEGACDDAMPAQCPSHGRIALRYALTAAGCALFALVYAQFSHGVYSPFMTFMFAIPLAGGALPALGLRLAKIRFAPRATRQAWALAIASLTIGSCLRGIFDIAGTGSAYLAVYLVLGVVFAIAAVVGIFRGSMSAMP